MSWWAERALGAAPEPVVTTAPGGVTPLMIGLGVAALIACLAQWGHR